MIYVPPQIASLLIRDAQRVSQSERSELRQAMIGLTNLMGVLDEDRPTILRELNSIEAKVDQILDQSDGES